MQCCLDKKNLDKLNFSKLILPLSYNSGRVLVSIYYTTSRCKLLTWSIIDESFPRKFWREGENWCTFWNENQTPFSDCWLLSTSRRLERYGNANMEFPLNYFERVEQVFRSMRKNKPGLVAESPWGSPSPHQVSFIVFISIVVSDCGEMTLCS